MSTKEKAKAIARIASSNEYSDSQKAVLLEVYGLSPAQGFKTLVKSGIYTTKGKLTPAYRPALKIAR